MADLLESGARTTIFIGTFAEWVTQPEGFRVYAVIGYGLIAMMTGYSFIVMTNWKACISWGTRGVWQAGEQRAEAPTHDPPLAERGGHCSDDDGPRSSHSERPRRVSRGSPGPGRNLVKKFQVKLSPGDRRQLFELIHVRRVGALKLAHARVLFMADCAPGGPTWTDWRIASAVRMSVATVKRTRRRYVEHGLASALGDRK
jgi:hypothetical protein